MLEIEVETSDDPTSRLATLETARKTAEGPLGDPKRAFGYALRGLEAAAGEANVAEWIDRVERLAEATGDWAAAARLYGKVVSDVLDEDVQQRLRLRIGELGRTKLGDKELAIAEYKKALEARADDRRALVALEELYEQNEDAPNLLEILKQRVEHAQNDEEKKQLLFREAALQSGPLADRAGAIATYEALLEVSLDPKAIASLDALYREAGRWPDLVALFERQLDGKVGNAADLRVAVAMISREHTGDVPRAFDELGEALALDGSHAGAVRELERLLASSERRRITARAPARCSNRFTCAAPTGRA